MCRRWPFHVREDATSLMQICQQRILHTALFTPMVHFTPSPPILTCCLRAKPSALLVQHGFRLPTSRRQIRSCTDCLTSATSPSGCNSSSRNEAARLTSFANTVLPRSRQVAQTWPISGDVHSDTAIVRSPRNNAFHLLLTPSSWLRPRRDLRRFSDCVTARSRQLTTSLAARIQDREGIKGVERHALNVTTSLPVLSFPAINILFGDSGRAQQKDEKCCFRE